MKTLIQSWILRALALTMATSVAFAQERVPFRQEELDQILAPVALYPDALLSQILMAATYPLEVVQAARWSRANPNLKGQDAVRAVERMDWDPSVKSLTAFPQILHMMDEKLEWTERLGEAFLAQQADVMDAVQELRRRADAAGNLGSNEHMQVRRDGDYIMIEPPAPEVVYVPYYDPRVAYGPWWWADYPPVYWAAPRAYYAPAPYPSLFFWGSGIAVSAGFFFGYPDWHHRHVTVVHRHVTVVDRQTTIVSPPPRERAVWRHNPEHRRGVPFRHAEARVRFEEERAARGETHRALERSGLPADFRRADQSRPADVRQRGFDERRGASPEPREPAASRVTPDSGADRTARPPMQRNAERMQPAPRSETSPTPFAPAAPRAEARNAPPQMRSAPPEAHSVQTESRAAQPQRFAPPPGDARSDRREAPRPQMRSAPPAAAVAPPVSAEPRSVRPHESRPAASAPQHGSRPEARQQRGSSAREQGDRGESRGRGGNRD
jgi:hypothetical protein